VEHLTLGQIAQALDQARTPEAAAIASALADHRIVGISGPAESGKTTLLQRALAPRQLDAELAVVEIDLDGVSSLRHLTRRWLRGIARAVAGPVAFSHMVSLDREMWPGRTRTADHEAREILRSEYDLALGAHTRGKPAADELDRALAATARLARVRPTLIVIDHLEAPELSGAFDVRALLWSVRAVTQREKRMSVALACRPGAVSLAADEDGAFFGDGTWLTISPPRRETWRSATDAWERVDRICELTDGHVWSTASLIERVSRREGLRVTGAFDALAREHAPLAARCVQHAATLHRLGPTLMRGIANGLGPYQAAPDAQSRDVAAAAQRLELAGLAYRPRRRVWRIVNPVVARALREPSPDFPAGPE
jgi:hypothetical protein